MTLPAGPHTVSLQLADVNALATTPIQNLSSATDTRVDPTKLLPVQSKSGVIAFVQAEWEAYTDADEPNLSRYPYFILDPQSTLPVSVAVSPDPAYPYGDPTVVDANGTVIAAQSALVYGFPDPGPAPRVNPAYSANLPGRWRRLNIGLVLNPQV